MTARKQASQQQQLYDRVRRADPVTRRVMLRDIADSFGMGFARQIEEQVAREDAHERATKAAR